ncbi:MAG: hypothetical protein R2828_00945 [Saprospiraceae bacterium]
MCRHIINLLLLLPLIANTQNIYLINASFEGEPQDATMPVGWHACEKGTTPDILPGQWGVYQEASDGDTYVGLITREDGSAESIGQRLKSPMAPKTCFKFQLDLARGGTYSTYNNPIRLRIWGGKTQGAKSQLLLETDLIKHTFWKTYEVEFTAKDFINYIILEAFYSEDGVSPRGNVLIDNISSIKACPRA